MGLCCPIFNLQEEGAEAIHADAHNLPFAEGYFDAILCTDSYIYFGTDDLYLDYLHQFVKPGGQIGITVPGFMHELNGRLPEHILPFWAQECWTWHTADLVALALGTDPACK